jgi:hypothetical protein
MIMMPFLDLATLPSVSSVLGARGKADLLNQISKDWGDGGTRFGQPDDLFLSNNFSFLQGLVNVYNKTADIVTNAFNAFTNRSQIHAITEPEQLKSVPAPMWVPILTMPKVRELLLAGSIHGFGVEAYELPKEDVAGRLIRNGTKVLVPGKEQQLVWVWKGSDTVYTVDEIEALQETRLFIDKFLESQMRKPVNQRCDPTDFPNLMGSLK